MKYVDTTQGRGFVGYRDNIRCLLGIHKFDEWRQVFGPFYVTENRVCERCKRTEWRDGFKGFSR